MSDWIWISGELAEAIHERQLSEHGGPSGLRDRGMFESALARPRQLAAYGGSEVDAPALAAAYAFGLARNHPFVDGNKRTAAVLCEVFLELNGYLLLAEDADLYPVFLGLADGTVGEDELADWLRRNSRPEQVSEGAADYRA
ncbi:type II toxin-antitoxin system death-on-curing family toxin [Wenzhouxiangella sp. EGI_FJ10409]|uniref:type II toxin-antitoxin system death-on-curing family toxin n=1 Tax=Wenzhouxiangella sp. EGI_FJ10409 TaxID=3243767 RepID=UPI0035DE82A9